MKLGKLITTLAAFALFSSALAACGGGGGGSDNDGNPAEVSIRTEPNSIDTGDRLVVTVRISNVELETADAFIIKILHPSALSYVSETSVLSRDDLADTEIDAVSAIADESAFLLYYLQESDFSTDDDAIIVFVLQGDFAVDDGIISVDVDIADSDTRANFDTSNPRFSPLAQTGVEVSDG